MNNEELINRYVKEALAYDVPAEVDFIDLCEKHYPNDLFMMEDCETQREREERYAIIVSMNREMWRYA